MPDPLPADLAEPLQASSNRRRGFGDQVLYFTETGSTNDVASALADRGVRRESVGAIRSLSVTHLLIHDLEPLGPAIASDPAKWGLKLIARTAPMNLYQISIDSAAERRNN